MRMAVTCRASLSLLSSLSSSSAVVAAAKPVCLIAREAPSGTTSLPISVCPLPPRTRPLRSVRPLRRLPLVRALPATLDGRVKTLHPAAHGGILAMRGTEHHMEALQQHGIGTIDVVVLNLYLFYCDIFKVLIRDRSGEHRYWRSVYD